jgi:hypothetical protein
VGDLLEAGSRGERRLGLAGAHGVTRGANIKRELTPLLNIANVLCLDAATMPRMLKTAETISVRMTISSITLTAYSCKIQKISPRGADHASEAPFSNGASLRGKNPAGPVARAGCMTSLNWVIGAVSAMSALSLLYPTNRHRRTGHVGKASTAEV